MAIQILGNGAVHLLGQLDGKQDWILHQGPGGVCGARHQDGPVEETPDHCGRGHQVVYTGRPSSMARQGHRVGIPTELLDVLLNPVEGSHLIHQAVVGHPSVGMRIGIGIQKT